MALRLHHLPINTSQYEAFHYQQTEQAKRSHRSLVMENNWGVKRVWLAWRKALLTHTEANTWTRLWKCLQTSLKRPPTGASSLTVQSDANSLQLIFPWKVRQKRTRSHHELSKSLSCILEVAFDKEIECCSVRKYTSQSAFNMQMQQLYASKL